MEGGDDGRGLAGDRRLEGHDVGAVGHGVTQLGDRRQQAGAVDFELVALLAEAKLDGEEVAGGQLVHFLLAGAQRGQSELLRELGKVAVGQQRAVAQNLVATVWLGRVERIA